MRRNVHKLLGLGLSLCLMLGGSLGPASTGYAADTSGEEIATVEASEQSQDIQEDTVQSETQNEDAEPDVQESEQISSVDATLTYGLRGMANPC